MCGFYLLYVIGVFVKKILFYVNFEFDRCVVDFKIGVKNFDVIFLGCYILFWIKKFYMYFKYDSF